MTVVWLQDAEGQPATLPAPPAVVLLHFSAPYKHAGHVLIRAGGRGHALAELASVGGVVRIARVWTCTNEAEVEERIYRIKGLGSRRRVCPICAGHVGREKG